MVTISESCQGGNRFFIYRENGVEADFTIERNKVITLYDLTPKEMNFIKKNYLQNTSKINNK